MRGQTTFTEGRVRGEGYRTDMRVKLIFLELTWLDGIQRDKDISQGCLLPSSWTSLAEREDGGQRAQQGAVICPTLRWLRSGPSHERRCGCTTRRQSTRDGDILSLDQQAAEVCRRDGCTVWNLKKETDRFHKLQINFVFIHISAVEF